MYIPFQFHYSSFFTILHCWNGLVYFCGAFCLGRKRKTLKLKIPFYFLKNDILEDHCSMDHLKYCSKSITSTKEFVMNIEQKVTHLRKESVQKVDDVISNQSRNSIKSY